VEPTQELIDAIYRDKVEAARRMSPDQKLFAGAELFDYACSISLAGIRHQFPDADERRAREILRDRLALRRRLERADWERVHGAGS
jgi:hypothetical protein